MTGGKKGLHCTIRDARTTGNQKMADKKGSQPSTFRRAFESVLREGTPVFEAMGKGERCDFPLPLLLALGALEDGMRTLGKGEGRELPYCWNNIRSHTKGVAVKPCFLHP